MAKKRKRYLATDGKLVLTLEIDEEGSYIVTAPFNTDIVTQADTIEEAFVMARDCAALMKASRAAEMRRRARATAK